MGHIVRTPTVTVAVAVLALLLQVLWLAFAGGSVGWITGIVIAVIGLQALTLGRVRWVHTLVRVALGVLFLGSVADRFGLLGGPGADGVSWGSYAEFSNYTRSLLPAFLDWATPVAAVGATAVEAVLGLALIAGVARRVTAITTCAVLAVFLLAMWTSVGVDEMLSYAVPVLAAGAALVGHTADSAHLELPRWLAAGRGGANGVAPLSR